jgi:hypothetical protein
MALSPYERAGGPSVNAARQVKQYGLIANMRLSRPPTCAKMESEGRRLESVMKTIAKLVTLLALGVTTVTPAAAGSVCLNPFYISESHVVDAKTILFKMKDGTLWRNDLKSSCPGLLFHGFTYRVNYDELCDYGQSIRVLTTGEVCTLGGFTKQSPARHI